MAYDGRHKKIVQALISAAMDEEAMRALCIELFNEETVGSIISDINEHISKEFPHISISSVRCELTGDLYWVYNSSHLGPREIYDMYKHNSQTWPESKAAYVKYVLQEIITSEAGCIPSMYCLNLSSLPEVKLSKAKAEEALSALVEENWLSYKDGQFYIGPKSAVTLMPYFKNNYEDYLKICSLCKQNIFHGKKCQHCSSVMHIYCLKNFALVHAAAVRCPECNNLLATDALADTNMLLEDQ